MKDKFLSLTEKGRWLLATLTLIFTLGIGQMWGADPIENVGTYSTQVISADGKTSTWTFIQPSSQVTVPNAETGDVDVIYVPSGSSKMKFSSSNAFSWSGTSSGYFYVPAGAAGTITMTVKSSSDSRYLQLYVAGSAAADSKRLWSKYNATPTSDGKKGPQSFSFTSSDLTTKGTKTYLHFKDNNTEMKIASISVTLTTGNYRNDLASYTITYDANGGSGTMSSSTNTVSDNGFTAPSATKVFDHWNDKADDTGDDYAVGATVTKDITLYAQWADKFTVTYDKNGGTGTMENTINEIVACTFTAPSGKGFQEWNTQADGKGTKYEVGATVSSNLDLYAIWKAVPTVLFHYQQANLSENLAAGSYSATGGTLTTSADMSKESTSYNAAVPSDLKGGANVGKLGSNAAYIQLTLTSGTFQEDDTVYICGYKSYKVSTTTSVEGDIAASVTTGTSKTDYNIGYAIIPSGVDQSSIYLSRAEGTGTGFAAVKVIRPAARPVYSTVITLSDVKVNNHSISSDSLAILTTAPAYALTLKDEYVTAPEIKFNEHKVITYADELLPATKATDKVYTVTATLVDGNWQAQQEIDGNTYTVKAPKQSSVKLAYYDGATKLGEETIGIGGHPAEYAAKQSKDFATFVAWYSNSDLAEEHKIANIAELVVNEATNVYGKWTPAYASSINIEQWVLDNGVNNTPFRAELTARNYQYTSLNNLDSLNDDPSKPYRNYAYLGQKVNKADSEISFLLKSGSTLNVRFGHIGTPLNVVIGSAEPVELTSAEYANDAPGDKKYTYTATEDVIVKFQTTGTSTCVFKQIMIDEEIAAVTLPLLVTYNAGTGTCATASAVWSGAALILPDVTPADADHTFAGWYDEETGGVLVGAAGASYNATDNVTLYAHFAPVEYAVNYAAGDHGSGSMSADAAGWGTEYTAVANGFAAEEGYLFAGWTVTGVDGVSTISNLGSFTMPKNDVTLTAIWEDNSKVAVIVETNVKYVSLAEAIAAATDGQTIQLLQNNNVTAQVEVAEKAITLDLAGYKIEYTGTSTLPSGVILVHNGASLTIDDSSDPDAGSIVSGEKAYAAIALTKAGDDAANPAILTVNGGTLSGYYYGITGNGSRHNTVTTINGGTIIGTCTGDNLGIYHPQNGTLTINGGTITAYSAAVEMRAGTLVINGGTFTATASEFSCNPNGSGTTTVGAAIAIAQHTTKTDIVVTIKGGTFEGEKAINESNPQANDPAPQVDLAVTGGDFTGEVSTVDVDHFISGGSFDAPVSNENCAEGFVPSPANPVTGKYSVEPKDGVCIIKATINSTTKNTIGEVTGLYKKDASCGGLSSYKFNGKGAYIGIELVAGQTFNEGDIINIHTTSAAGQGTIALFDNHGNTVSSFHDYGVMGGTGDNKFALPASAEDKSIIYVCRTEANTWNGYVDYIEVTRAMNPLLTAITIDERAGVIDPLDDKHFNVQIPYEADLANLTIVPTIAWNAPAAENSIVVNDGGAWVEGNNTYKLTDKDGDYTIYTLTLTRDVLKHTVSFNTHGGSAVASELVVDGESLEAAPAAPEKEDYLFQGWAETDGGAIVDVTTFAISADKEFHAVWAPDGALKLINKTSGVVNEDGYFITGVTATEANSEKAAAWGGTQGATISGTNQLGKIVQYNATTNQTKLQIKVYNTNNSDKYVYIHKIIEGNTTEETVETLTATSKTVVTSEYYEFNNTKNRSFYITTNSTDVKILQVKVIESGETPMKKAGEAGYSLNLNKGRALYYANSDVTLEGLGLQSASNYNVISSTEFQTTKNFSFSISTPVLLKVTTNTAKYYVSQDPDEDGTTATAVTDAGTAEFNLTTTGTWYLVPSTTSNVKYTNIAFELPKAATPVIETQPATNHTFNPGDMTATVVATVSEGTLHYQWYKKATVGDDEEVGTDAATLTTTTEGTYYVVVTNVLAGHQDVSVTSEEAELGYRVTNDATLMALSYGGTAITLEDGVYNYNVELAKGTTDVPALAATATMDGYADVDINDAAEFVNYEASSTVTVKSEDLTETNVYTVNFYVKHDLPQVDVTATTVWNWANAATTMQTIKPATKNVEQLMANIDDEGKQLKNDADFNSQALIFSGQEALTGNSTRWYAKGGHIKFNVTVPGIVEVEFSDNGDNNRRIKINNAVSTVASANNTDVKTYKAYVQPGEVTLMGVKNDGTGEDQYIRISKITFTANPTPDYTRTVSNNIGTLCVDHNVLVGGALGATFYQIASRNEQYNDKIDFEEVLPNEELKAGEPYIFKSTTGRIDLFYGETEADAPVAVRGMIGSFADANLPITEENKSDILYIAQNKLWNCEDLVGVGLDVVANRAYIVMSGVPTYAEYQEAQTSNPAPRRRVTLGKDATQTATGVDNLNVSETPLKVMIDGQLYIIRGDKMYDATGRLVK